MLNYTMRDRRVAMGFTRKELARVVGTDHDVIVALENSDFVSIEDDGVDCLAEVLDRVALCLEMCVGDLFVGECLNRLEAGVLLYGEMLQEEGIRSASVGEWTLLDDVEWQVRIDELSDVTDVVLGDLTFMEAQVLRMRFGLRLNKSSEAPEGRTYLDIARHCGLEVKQVRKHERAALRKLNAPKYRRLLGSYLRGACI